MTRCAVRTVRSLERRVKKIVFVAFMAVAMVVLSREFRDYQRISNAVDELAAACKDSGRQPRFVLPPIGL